MANLCDQAGPSCLMGGSDASPVIAVKVFVKIDVVAKVWIPLENLVLSIERSPIVVAS